VIIRTVDPVQHLRVSPFAILKVWVTVSDIKRNCCRLVLLFRGKRISVADKSHVNGQGNEGAPAIFSFIYCAMTSVITAVELPGDGRTMPVVIRSDRYLTGNARVIIISRQLDVPGP